uniref:TNF receptor-associated factor n=1 Tax=Latimeria chalumnae TaxID=7897 RepID=H3B5Y8_LATCH
MDSEQHNGDEPDALIRQNSTAIVSTELNPIVDYMFVATLEDRYKCVCCGYVLHDPYQTACGHRFSKKCIDNMTQSMSQPKCPIDSQIIKLDEIFKDACCRREVLNLQIFCINSPDCKFQTTVGHLKDHLEECLFQTEQCDQCNENILRKDMKHHLEYVCSYRKEMYKFCKESVLPHISKENKKREEVCMILESLCILKNFQIIFRTQVVGGLSISPQKSENQNDFHYFKCRQVNKEKISEHEKSYLAEHLVLVSGRYSELDKKISDLSQQLRDPAIQQLKSSLESCENEIKQLQQQNTKDEALLTFKKNALDNQDTKIKQLEMRLNEVIRNQERDRNELRALTETVENLKRKIFSLEDCTPQLLLLRNQSTLNEKEISRHADQLSKNEERFKVLEGASYNGRLIWKIWDYTKKKQEAVEGHVFYTLSQPFYTSRFGYKMCARAYLNGDGAGKGTHLSLFFLVMRGEYDSLLPWPFKQKVTLMLLDQSGNKNHISETFKADPTSSSFKKPTGEMNIASGCPKFVNHDTLENPKNATYIKEDVLFIKVIVDVADLEEL